MKAHVKLIGRETIADGTMEFRFSKPELLIDLKVNEDNIRTEEFNGYGEAAELNAKRPEHARA